MYQGRVKICACGGHAAVTRRTGGVLYVDRDLDACASMIVILIYAACHNGDRHPAYRPPSRNGAELRWPRPATTRVSFPRTADA